MTAQVHERFMKRCIELANIAKLNNKTAVGSLIVENEGIIAEGIEGTQDLHTLLAHAEINAMINAIAYTGSNNLGNCILYTTVEPCFMCSYLIRQTCIKEVVFGTTTPEIGGCSSQYPFLTATDIIKWGAPPLIIEGILKEECERLLA